LGNPLVDRWPPPELVADWSIAAPSIVASLRRAGKDGRLVIGDGGAKAVEQALAFLLAPARACAFPRAL